jgi:NAD(P)H-hydrate epimerase
MAVDHFDPVSASVYVGTGGNGGGGLVAARHMANLGVAVNIVTTRDAEHFAPVPRHQLEIVERMGLSIGSDPVEADLAVDALVGYSLHGAPRGAAAEFVTHLCSSEVQVLALDLPSGLDASTGATPGVVVQAAVTMTLALPKRGLLSHPAVGRLFVGDISVPPGVYATMGLDGAAPPFEHGPIVEIIGPSQAS